MLFRQYLETWCKKLHLRPDDWGELARTLKNALPIIKFPDGFVDYDFNLWMKTFQFRQGTPGRRMLAELYIKWLHFEGLHLLFEDEVIGNHVTAECWKAWSLYDDGNPGEHPCDDWRALECVCGGQCQCHWKVEPGDEDDDTGA